MANKQPEPIFQPETQKKFSLLYLDNDAEDRHYLFHTLLKTPYHVILADTAVLALQKLESISGICLVIADYHIPLRSGVSFLEEVAQRWPNISRIMCTDQTDIRIAKHAINNGRIMGCLSKPWQFTDLVDSIESGIKAYQLNSFYAHVVKTYRYIPEHQAYAEKLMFMEQEFLQDTYTALTCFNSTILALESATNPADHSEASIKTRQREIKSQVIYSNLTIEKFKLFAEAKVDYQLLRQKKFTLEIAPESLKKLTSEVVKTLNDCFFHPVSVEFNFSQADFIIGEMDIARLKRCILSLAMHYNPMASEPITLKISHRDYSHLYSEQFGYIVFEFSSSDENPHSKHLNNETFTSDILKSTVDEGIHHSHLTGPSFDLFITHFLMSEMEGKIGLRCDNHPKLWLEFPVKSIA